MPTAAWQLDVLRAFQSWAVLGNINIGLVSDDGEAPGQPGPLQGNPGFGDIRVGARPLSNDRLATSTPFDLLNNWSGDVMLNSQAAFGDRPGRPRTCSPPRSTRPGSSSAWPRRRTTRPRRCTPWTLAPAPARPPPTPRRFRPSTASGRRGPTATTPSRPPRRCPSSRRARSRAPLAAPLATDAEISRLSDLDIYSVTAPAGGAFSVVVRTSGVSLLTARLTVYDASGRPVAAAAAPDPLHGDLTVTVPAPRRAHYYARVESARPDVFGVGSYRIAAGRPGLAGLAVSLPAAPGGGSTAGAGNDSFQKALGLTPQSTGTDARWEYLDRDRLTSPGQTDYFRVQSDPSPAGAMIVTVWGDRPGGLAPRVTVFDARHNVVPAQVVARDGGGETVQVLSPAAGARYVIAVSAAGPGGSPFAVGGDYTLAVTDRATPLVIPTLASGTLGVQSQAVATLTVASAALYHFDLSGHAGVSLTVFDASNHPVEQIHALGGAGSSAGDVLLTPGMYTLRVRALGPGRGSSGPGPLHPPGHHPLRPHRPQPERPHPQPDRPPAVIPTPGTRPRQAGRRDRQPVLARCPRPDAPRPVRRHLVGFTGIGPIAARPGDRRPRPARPGESRTPLRPALPALGRTLTWLSPRPGMPMKG